jgi:SSS family solute:Na+ symporter
MAGMAANVSSFNTVFTYDIWRPYIRPGRSDRHYLNVGRTITVIGIVIGIGTAFIASGYSNIMVYVQLLFSFFNAPLFATFIIAMFWKRTTPWAGLAGLVAGTVGAGVMHLVAYRIGYFYPGGEVADHDLINAQMVNFYSAIVAFAADAVVTVLVTLVTKPKPIEELRGLVWGVPDPDAPEADRAGKPRTWWENPKVLGFGALALTAALSIVFL